MNMQINRLQTGINYPNPPAWKPAVVKAGPVRAGVSMGRLSGVFADIQTESEMIRSAKMLVESAKAAQAGLNDLLGDFGIRQSSEARPD